VAAGDLDTAAVLVLAGVVGLTGEEVAALRSDPRWPGLLATTPTVPRECRAEDGWVYRPGRLAGVTAPTLLLSGSETPPDVKAATGQAAAAIGGARVQVLEGHAHLAHRSDPAVVAAAIRRFVLA
jgi:pimeloyl-ACP methyl ester carboxylesterase